MINFTFFKITLTEIIMPIFVTKNYTYLLQNHTKQMFLMQMFHEFISCKWINLQTPRYYDES